MDAANEPLSIIIVGVGDEEFEEMEILDGDDVGLMDENGRCETPARQAHLSSDPTNLHVHVHGFASARAHSLTHSLSLCLFPCPPLPHSPLSLSRHATRDIVQFVAFKDAKSQEDLAAQVVE